jgi:hypothetical protein
MVMFDACESTKSQSIPKSAQIWPDGHSLISYLECFRCEYAVGAEKPAAQATHLHIHDPISRRAEPESPTHSQGRAATIVTDVSCNSQYGQSSDHA